MNSQMIYYKESTTLGWYLEIDNVILKMVAVASSYASEASYQEFFISTKQQHLVWSSVWIWVCFF